MAISQQRLTIYLYSAHRAVIFATAQLSCLCLCAFMPLFLSVVLWALLPELKRMNENE